MNRILFVDDESEVLGSIRDGLRRRRDTWSMVFADSGGAALAEFESEPVDVVVTDLQMPGMDGAALLERVRDFSPETIRIVLSGYASASRVARVATAAHRFLAKPCDIDELTCVLERSCALRDLNRQTALYRTATGAVLPSCPGLYVELAQATADAAVTPSDLAAIVERDTAMTAKLLQLANSAFFGSGRQVSSVRDAIMLLGTNTLESLVLTAEAFADLSPQQKIKGFSIDALQRHSTLVARLASAIMPDGPERQDALTAGLLHDIGMLVLAVDDPAECERVIATANLEQLPLHVIERREHGVTHAEVGAYLLSLWGLPLAVVEAVAHHDEPGRSPELSLDAVSAVCIANFLVREQTSGSDGHPASALLDQGYIDQLGVGSQLVEWRELAAREAEAAAV
jgi:putative nucleotidyltransferase with HDIG domain